METDQETRARLLREAQAYEDAGAALEHLVSVPQGERTVEDLDDDTEREYVAALVAGVRARLGYVPWDEDDPYRPAATVSR